MLCGCRLTTILIVIILFNPSQIMSGTQKASDRGANQNDDLPTNPVVHRDNIIPENDGTARFEHAQHRHIHEQQIQKKQVDQEHHLGRHHDNINSRSGPEKDGEIHLNGVDRHVQEHRQEREDFSGDVHGHRAEIREIHNSREAADNEDQQFSGVNKENEKHSFHHITPRDYKHNQLSKTRANSDREYSEKHLHSLRKKGSDEEFGYLTEDDNAVLPEENDDRPLSGNREYDHVHLKTKQKHREMSHVRSPRDSHVADETIELENARNADDENLGEMHVHRNVRQLNKTRDFHVDRKQTDQQIEGEDDEGESSAEEEERVFKRRDVHLLTGEKRIENESGEIEEPSRGRQESISDRDDEVKRFHSRDSREEKKDRKDLYQPKSEKGHSSGSEYSSTKKSRAYRSINPVHFINELNNDDFYITENDEPHEKPNIVEMRNFEEVNEFVGEDKEPIAKKAQNLDEGVEAVQKFSRGPLRHLLQFGNKENSSLDYRLASSTQCSHPSFPDKIPDDEIIYIRDECRLCQCTMGELTCEPKPELCAEPHDKKPCFMVKGKAMADGERHFDGCNNCLCRNGEFLCTRVRCPLANYNYTNYHAIINILNNTSNPDVYEGPIRRKDPCMECDYDPNSPVCGPNWKTYRSMCHAMYCGGHKIEHVIQGACEALNPCDEALCAENEICLIRRRDPCLATTTTDGNIVECRQYQCVNPSEDCGSVFERKVCGEDHITYSNECTMFAQGVALAYYGACKEECLGDDPRMCGVDGVTFPSNCHVTLLNSHVDYPGECDEVDPQYNIVMTSSDLYYNRRCKTVKELARCPPIDCKQHVIPEGSCCPVCGTSISIRLDTSAKDMTTLKTPEHQPFYQLNRIGLIYNTLKTLSNQFESFDKCHLTADLVDTNDISVVYEPIIIKDEVACAQVAEKTVAHINSPAKDDVDPGLALLAAAVVVNHSDPTLVPRAESMISIAKKRRKKRSEHHENEPFYNKNERICPQAIVVYFYMVVGLYWSSNLAEF